jgi:hypothetical protein
MVLSDIIIFLMVAGLLGGLIYVMASPNRYAKMTDEEFEEDTKGSVLGSVVIGMERALRRREADLVIKEKLRVERTRHRMAIVPPRKLPSPRKKSHRARRDLRRESAGGGRACQRICSPWDPSASESRKLRRFLHERAVAWINAPAFRGRGY